jgi:hypothetical protein
MFRHFARRSVGLAIAAVAAACLGVVTSTAAVAGVDSITISGFGTVSPGYPVTACYPQTSFAFTGDVTVDVGGNPGVGTAYYDAASLGCETITAGQGTGTLTLTDDLDVGSDWGGGTVSYFRTGTSMTLSGSLTFNGVDYSIVLGTCDFWYTDANPSTSYQIDCQLLLT